MMMATGLPAMFRLRLWPMRQAGITKASWPSKADAREGPVFECFSKLGRCRPVGNAAASGNNVGSDLVLDLDDTVLEDELALLQALDLQLVAGDHIFECIDRHVQIPVLLLQPREFHFEFSQIVHRKAQMAEPPGTGRWKAKLCSRAFSRASAKPIFCTLIGSLRQRGLPSTRHFLCVTLLSSDVEKEVIDMPLQNHLVELERKHQALEREIQDALNHPSMDDTKMAELKRKKLQLKDQITRLKGVHAVMH